PMELRNYCRTSSEGKGTFPIGGWRRKPSAKRLGRAGDHLRGDGTIEALVSSVNVSFRYSQLAPVAPMLQFLRISLVVSLTLASSNLLAQSNERNPVAHPTFYRTIQIDGLSIFYREAAPKDAPTLLLLHGLPSSSRMFEPLFARLSGHYHLIAPDYPGFGHSDWPDPKKFAYTFDHYAEIIGHFTEALGLTRYTLYLQDY